MQIQFGTKEQQHLKTLVKRLVNICMTIFVARNYQSFVMRFFPTTMDVNWAWHICRQHANNEIQDTLKFDICLVCCKLLHGILLQGLCYIHYANIGYNLSVKHQERIIVTWSPRLWPTINNWINQPIINMKVVSFCSNINKWISKRYFQIRWLELDKT